MRTLFTLCALIYLIIYAFEGAIRYGLYNIGADSAILLRDALIVGPVALLLIVQAFRLSVHPAYVAFAAIVTLHGAISIMNLHSTLPAIYGAKLLVTTLFGFIAGRQLTQPSRRILWLLGLLWIVSTAGVLLDKFVYIFPWMGLETHVGGIQVDVSRGWDIDSGFDKRAAGFTRSSIAAAMLLPILAFIIVPRIHSFIVRFLILAITVGAVFLTTQKGAVLAAAAVAALLCGPAWSRYYLLCFACLVFALIDIALPVGTGGLLMSYGDGGVFSFASFAMRITLTWPDAWRWIMRNDVFPFGVGLGGIGGAQRFYAANFFNPSDNLFVFLYANFGMFGLLYLGWLTCLPLHLPRHLREPSIAALSILAFNLGYGAALSMLEDQMSALFIGASAGMLWQLHQKVRGRPWIDPYRGALRDYQPPLVTAYTAGLQPGAGAS